MGPNKEILKHPVKRPFLSLALGLGLLAQAPSVYADGNTTTPQSIVKPTASESSGLDFSQFDGSTDETKTLLSQWSNQPLTQSLRRQVMSLAISYFVNQLPIYKGTNPLKNPVTDYKKSAQDYITFLNDADFAGKNKSTCDDKNTVPASLNTPWLLSLKDNKLYINDGFNPDPNSTVYDLFFSYGIGIYSVLPINKVYDGGTTSYGSKTVVTQEKGLVMVSPTDSSPLNLFSQFKGNCVFLYRYPLMQAFPSNAALEAMTPFSFTPDKYSQENVSGYFKQKVLDPYFEGSTKVLMPFYLYSDSSDFYKIIGKAATGSNDSDTELKAADSILSDVISKFQS